MRTYILFVSQDREDHWYGYYDKYYYKWSGWISGAAINAVTATLVEYDGDNDTLEEFTSNPETVERILYQGSTPLTLETHPEFFI